MSTSEAGRTVVAAAVGIGLLTLGGCMVDSGERDAPSGKVAQVLEDGRGEFDLASPPDRAEVGLPDGRSHVTYERADKSPFHVVVALPEGRRLDLDVRLVGFDSLGSADPATGPPTTMDIHYYPTGLATAREYLEATAHRFGLDRAAIEEWYEQASNPRPAAAPSTVRSRWLSTELGYLRLQVQGRYSPPVEGAGAEQVVVHYALTWAGGPSPGPS